MRLFFLLIGLLSTTFLVAQSGYRIDAEIQGYEPEELYLGYHYGNKQYLLDTAKVNANGRFIFEGDEALKGGIYLLVMAPDNDYFQVLITDTEQRFSFSTKAENPAQHIRFKDAPDNELFYSYLAFLEKEKPEADRLAKAIEEATDDKEKTKLEEKRNKIDERVKNYQDKMIKDYPDMLSTAIIKANVPIDLPEFEGAEDEIRLKNWQHTKEHFFDNIDLADPYMLRTPFLFQKVDYYVNKLQVQHPDSISMAIDRVLKLMEPAEETFKFYLIHFLNEYAKSNIVGMDAVYVHMVNNYYAKGRAPWTEEDQLKKIIDNANALEPLLIGKVAPNIKLEKRNGDPVELHDIESDITILYFWRYDCGHCKKSTPDMKKFYDQYKDKGVTLVAVCAKFTDELPGCWEYVDKNEIDNWMHLIDTYHRSRYMKVYNIKSTPQLYVLDKDKTILSKRIGAEQLEEVVDRIIEMKKQEQLENADGK
jgi:peroxiredoxin